MASTSDIQKIDSPVGRKASEGAAGRAKRSQVYRDAAAEYAAIAELRKKNWIAAHIRERRFELEMTQQQVAEAADTKASYISKVEKGDHLPSMPVLKRILAVLDEELVISIREKGVPADEAEREEAPLPELVAA